MKVVTSRKAFIGALVERVLQLAPLDEVTIRLTLKDEVEVTLAQTAGGRKSRRRFTHQEIEFSRSSESLGDYSGEELVRHLRMVTQREERPDEHAG